MKSAYQDVAEEVRDLKGIEEAVALAIEREKEAREFYLYKAALMDNPKFKELYEYLADEELKHLGYLEKYRDTKELPIVSTKVRSGQSFTPEFNPARAKEGAITLGDTGILLAAMRHERKSEDFYLGLVKKQETMLREVSSRCCQNTREGITGSVAKNICYGSGIPLYAERELQLQYPYLSFRLHDQQRVLH